MLNKSKFFIVAIGLSAGGLEPLHSFFSQIPPDSGLAFIVIPHLNRDYVSVADKLLAKHTTMPVCWARQGEAVAPNRVYMLPVNKMMTIQDGYLQLQPRQVEDKVNWAVDIFFTSLAKDEKAQAIGIVLSGAGSDGAKGAIAIHNEDGLVLVQDPQTAEFSSMPRSVILQDSPSQILSPKRLAKSLMSFVAESA